MVAETREIAVTTSRSSSTSVLGHLMAPRDPKGDHNLHLGEEDWQQHFQSVPITHDDWGALMKDGVDEALRTIATGLVGESEESWFDANQLVLLCNTLDGDASERTRQVLRSIANLARDAFARGAPVILSL